MTTVQFPRDPDDALYEYLAEKARVCGGGADEIWEGLCTRFALPPAQTDDRAARWVENRMQDYVAEHATYDHETGYTGLSTAGEEYVGELQNIAEGLRALNLTAPVVLKYDDTLLPFLAHMRAELHANAHKGDREGWLRMTLEQALDEIRHHHDKLVIPVMNHDREAIREHAADVANCAMMLADIAGVLSRE